MSDLRTKFWTKIISVIIIVSFVFNQSGIAWADDLRVRLLSSDFERMRYEDSHRDSRGFSPKEFNQLNKHQLEEIQKKQELQDLYNQKIIHLNKDLSESLGEINQKKLKDLKEMAVHIQKIRSRAQGVANNGEENALLAQALNSPVSVPPGLIPQGGLNQPGSLLETLNLPEDKSILLDSLSDIIGSEQPTFLSQEEEVIDQTQTDVTDEDTIPDSQDIIPDEEEPEIPPTSEPQDEPEIPLASGSSPEEPEVLPISEPPQETEPPRINLSTADGLVLTYKGDILERIKKTDGTIIDAPTFDEKGRLLSGVVTLIDGTIVEYNGSLIQTETTEDGRLTTYTYEFDENNNILKTTLTGSQVIRVYTDDIQPVQPDREDRVSFNAYGYLTSILTALGNTYYYQSDLQDKVSYLVKFVDQNGDIANYQNGAVSSITKTDGTVIENIVMGEFNEVQDADITLADGTYIEQRNRLLRYIETPDLRYLNYTYERDQEGNITNVIIDQRHSVFIDEFESLNLDAWKIKDKKDVVAEGGLLVLNPDGKGKAKIESKDDYDRSTLFTIKTDFKLTNTETELKIRSRGDKEKRKYQYDDDWYEDGEELWEEQDDDWEDDDAGNKRELAIKVKDGRVYIRAKELKKPKELDTGIRIDPNKFYTVEFEFSNDQSKVYFYEKEAVRPEETLFISEIADWAPDIQIEAKHGKAIIDNIQVNRFTQLNFAKPAFDPFYKYLELSFRDKQKQDLQAQSLTYAASGNLLEYLTPTGLIVRYNLDGLLSSIAAPDGRETLYTYTKDENGNIIETRLTNNGPLSFFDKDAILTQRIEENGTSVFYQGLFLNNILSPFEPALRVDVIQTDIAFSQGPNKNYIYAAADASGKYILAKIIDCYGNTFNYDEHQKITSVETLDGDILTNVILDENGFVKDADITLADGTHIKQRDRLIHYVQTPALRYLKYTYIKDAQGNIIRVVINQQQTIFKDEFNSLDSSHWELTKYDDDDDNHGKKDKVSVQDGKLVINPEAESKASIIHKTEYERSTLFTIKTDFDVDNLKKSSELEIFTYGKPEKYKASYGDDADDEFDDDEDDDGDEDDDDWNRKDRHLGILVKKGKFYVKYRELEGYKTELVDINLEPDTEYTVEFEFSDQFSKVYLYPKEESRPEQALFSSTLVDWLPIFKAEAKNATCYLDNFFVDRFIQSAFNEPNDDPFYKFLQLSYQETILNDIEAIWIQYDGQGNIIELTKPNGTYVHYTVGLIDKVITPDEKVTTYIYQKDEWGDVIHTTVLRDNILRKYDTAEHRYQLEFLDGSLVNYNPDNSVASIQKPDGTYLDNLRFDLETGEILDTDILFPEGYKKIYRDKRLVGAVYADGTQLTFDENNNILTYITADGRNFNLFYGATPEGNQIINLENVYKGEQMVFEEGILKEKLDNLNVKTTYEYDQQGRLIRQVQTKGNDSLHEFTYTYADNTFTVVDEKGVARTYDSQTERLLSSVMPDGREYVHSLLGEENLVQLQPWVGDPRLTYEFYQDEFGNTQRRIATFNDPIYGQSIYTYINDTSDIVDYITQQDGTKRYYELYTDINALTHQRITQIIDNLGNITNYNYASTQGLELANVIYPDQADVIYESFIDDTGINKQRVKQVIKDGLISTFFYVNPNSDQLDHIEESSGRLITYQYYTGQQGKTLTRVASVSDPLLGLSSFIYADNQTDTLSYIILPDGTKVYYGTYLEGGRTPKQRIARIVSPFGETSNFNYLSLITDKLDYVEDEAGTKIKFETYIDDSDSTKTRISSVSEAKTSLLWNYFYQEAHPENLSTIIRSDGARVYFEEYTGDDGRTYTRVESFIDAKSVSSIYIYKSTQTQELERIEISDGSVIYYESYTDKNSQLKQRVLRATVGESLLKKINLVIPGQTPSQINFTYESQNTDIIKSISLNGTTALYEPYTDIKGIRHFRVAQVQLSDGVLAYVCKYRDDTSEALDYLDRWDGLRLYYEDFTDATGQTKQRVSKVLDTQTNEESIYTYLSPNSGLIEFVSLTDGTKLNYETYLDKDGDAQQRIGSVLDTEGKISTYKYQSSSSDILKEIIQEDATLLSYEVYAYDNELPLYRIIQVNYPVGVIYPYGAQEIYHYVAEESKDIASVEHSFILEDETQVNLESYFDTEGILKFRIKTTELASGEVTTYNYVDNTSSLLKSLSLSDGTTFEYDELGRIISITDQEGRTSYTYFENEPNLISSITLPDNTKIDYQIYLTEGDQKDIRAKTITDGETLEISTINYIDDNSKFIDFIEKEAEKKYYETITKLDGEKVNRISKIIVNEGTPDEEVTLFNYINETATPSTVILPDAEEIPFIEYVATYGDPRLSLPALPADPQLKLEMPEFSNQNVIEVYFAPVNGERVDFEDLSTLNIIPQIRGFEVIDPLKMVEALNYPTIITQDLKLTEFSTQEGFADDTDVVMRYDSEGKLSQVTKADGTVYLFANSLPQKIIDAEGNILSDFTYDNKDRLLSITFVYARQRVDDLYAQTQAQTYGERDVALQSLEEAVQKARDDVAQEVADAEADIVAERARLNGLGSGYDISQAMADVDLFERQLYEKEAQAYIDIENEYNTRYAELMASTEESLNQLQTWKSQMLDGIIYQEISNLVESWYRLSLGRLPDNSEEDYWVVKAQNNEEFDGVTIKNHLESLPEFTQRTQEVETIISQVREDLDKYVNGTDEEKQAVLSRLGIVQDNTVPISKAESFKIASWLYTLRPKFARGAVECLRELLNQQAQANQQTLNITHQDLTSNLILTDILTGTINYENKIEPEINLSIYSLLNFAQSQGIELFAYKSNYSEISQDSGSFIAHLNNNLFVLVTAVTNDSVTYFDFNLGPHGQTVELSRNEFLNLWDGIVISPRAPPETALALTSPQAKEIKGSFTQIFIDPVRIAFGSLIDKTKTVFSNIKDFLISFLNLSPQEKYTQLQSLGLASDAIVEVTPTFINATLNWLNSQFLNLINCSDIVLTQFLGQFNLQPQISQPAQIENIAFQTKLIDILSGAVNPQSDLTQSGLPLQTSMYAISKVAELQGLNLTAAKVELEDLQELTHPAIASVDLDKDAIGDHYVLVTKVTESEVTYLEVDGKKYTLSKDAFNQRFTGYILTDEIGKVQDKEISEYLARDIQGGKGGGFIIAIIAVAFLPFAAPALAAISAAVSGIGASIGAVATGIGTAMGSVLGGIGTAVGTAISAVGSVVGGAISAVGSVISGVSSVVGHVAEGLQSLGKIYETIQRVASNILVTEGLNAAGFEGPAANVVAALISGGAYGYTHAAGNALQYALREAATQATIAGVVEVGREVGMDPALASVVSVVAGSLVSVGLDFDPTTTLADAVKDLAPTVAGELAYIGVQELAEEVGLDPRIAYLAGIPVKVSITNSLGKALDLPKYSDKTLWTGLTEGLLKGAVSVGIQYAVQETELDPLIGALASSAITGAIQGAISKDINIFQGIYNGYQSAIGNTLTLGNVGSPPLRSTFPTDEAYQSALNQYNYARTQYLSRVRDFSTIIQERGFENAIEEYSTSIFHQQAVDNIAGEGGIVDLINKRIAQGKTKVVQIDGQEATEFPINEEDSFTLSGRLEEKIDPNATDIRLLELKFGDLSLRAALEKEWWGVDEFDRFGLYGGRLAQPYPEGINILQNIQQGQQSKVDIIGPSYNYNLLPNPDYISFNSDGSIENGLLRELLGGLELYIENAQFLATAVIRNSLTAALPFVNLDEETRVVSKIIEGATEVAVSFGEKVFRVLSQIGEFVTDTVDGIKTIADATVNWATGLEFKTSETIQAEKQLELMSIQGLVQLGKAELLNGAGVFTSDKTIVSILTKGLEPAYLKSMPGEMLVSHTATLRAIEGEVYVLEAAVGYNGLSEPIPYEEYFKTHDVIKVVLPADRDSARDASEYLFYEFYTEEIVDGKKVFIPDPTTKYNLEGLFGIGNINSAERNKFICSEWWQWGFDYDLSDAERDAGLTGLPGLVRDERISPQDQYGMKDLWDESVVDVFNEAFQKEYQQ